MTTAAWRICLFLLSFLWCGAEAWLTHTSCTSTISIRCSRHHTPFIHILSVNTTSRLAPSILEKCNAHKKECDVPNTDNKCIEVTYWCHTRRKNLEIRQAKTTRMHVNFADSTEMSLTSGGYSMGKYQEAQNISCGINSANLTHCSSTLDFYIREFAPFIDSTEFCLNLNSGPPICTGSQKFNEYFATAHMYARHLDIGHFTFTLARNATTVPLVRFWIAINIKRYEAKYRSCIVTLRCTSTPVKLNEDQQPKGPKAHSLKADTNGRKSNNKLIPVVVVFCCLTVLFAAAFAWAMITKRRSVTQVGLPSLHAGMGQGDKDFLVSQDT